MRLGRQQPVLITSAAEPRQGEIKRRQRRYVVSMLLRTALFVLAVIAFDGVARFVAIVVALVLPWVAVVVANGGPPRAREDPSLFTARAPAEAPATPQLEPEQHPVVDGEVAEPPPSQRSPSSPPSPPFP